MNAGLTAGTVKICSLREVEHSAFVVEARADLFGLIFVPGVRREVTPERGRDIVQAVAAVTTSRKPAATGVFVDASVEEINRIAALVGLDFAQLHGNESPEALDQISVPSIKAIRPAPGDTIEGLLARMDRFANAARPPAAFLIDGFNRASHGGDGTQADWAVAAALAARFPVMLAGGLSPENVADAIAHVRPLGVDVSSGVETGGVKDQRKIGEFVDRARIAFSR